VTHRGPQRRGAGGVGDVSNVTSCARLRGVGTRSLKTDGTLWRFESRGRRCRGTAWDSSTLIERWNAETAARESPEYFDPAVRARVPVSSVVGEPSEAYAGWNVGT